MKNKELPEIHSGKLRELPISLKFFGLVFHTRSRWICPRRFHVCEANSLFRI